MKFTKYILLFFIVCYNLSAQGQYRRNFRGFGIQSNIEFGLGVGTSNYQGDLSVGAFTWELTKMNIGGFVRAKPFENIAFRAGINFGKVVGDDKEWGKLYNEYDFKYGAGSVKQAQYYERYKRNLNFRSLIFEVNAMMEINLYKSMVRRRTVTPLPYAVLGIGVFHFNPRTTDRYGQEVFLHQYPTELYKSYKRWQVCLPAGIGIKLSPEQNWYITIELVYRKLFTDWLDDVHHNYAGPPAAGNVYLQQLSDRSGEVKPYWGVNWDKVTLDPNESLRGNPKTNDSYVFTMITINHAIRRYATCTNF